MVNWPVFHYNFQFLEVKNIQKFTVNVLSAFYHIWNFSKGPRATLNCKHSSFHFAVVPGLETSPSLQARAEKDWTELNFFLNFRSLMFGFLFQGSTLTLLLFGRGCVSFPSITRL